MNVEYDKLLAGVIASKGGGENLVADPRCREIIRIAKGPPAPPPPPPGEPVPPVKEPDWAEVRDGCIELLGRSADLTIAVWYVVALLKNDRWAGLAEGLGAVRYMLENLYDKVFPELDPDEPQNPGWRRVKVINNLAVPIAARDDYGVLRRIRDIPLVASRNLGSFSFWNILVAGGTMPPRDESDPKAEMATIDRAFADVEVGQLEETLKSIRLAREHAREIVAVFKGDSAQNKPSRAPAGEEPTLTHLIRMLEDCATQVEKALSDRGRKGEGTAPPTTAGPVEPARGGGNLREITSKNDVQMALDKIVGWYMQDQERQASPTWLMVAAARQMMGKSVSEVFETLDKDFVMKLKEISNPTKQA